MSIYITYLKKLRLSSY